MLTRTLSLLRATEAAAIAASEWIGTGDKLSADKAATEAMRERINSIPGFAAQIKIGEGEKDHSYGLFYGETLGQKREQEGVAPLDLAVDPIDGTRPTVTSGPEALSVIAVAESNSLYTTKEFYMNKIAYGPEIASKLELDLKDPPGRIVELVSAVTGKAPHNIVVCLLDRDRHKAIITELRKLKVKLN